MKGLILMPGRSVWAALTGMVALFEQWAPDLKRRQLEQGFLRIS